MSSVKVNWKGKELTDAIKKAGAEGLLDASQFLLDESLKIVPLDEGILANSGNTSIDKDTLQATVYFDTPYALRQHEDLTLQHKNGRSAKYLETPTKANKKKLQDLIVNKMKGVT